MRTSIAVPILLASLLLLLPAASAHANATDDRIVDDCGRSPTGLLTGSYKQSELRHALRNVPGDSSDYTGCYDAIRQAIFDSRGTTAPGDGHPSTGAGDDRRDSEAPSGGDTADGGSTDTSGVIPDARPPAGADRPVEVAGTTLTPGALPAFEPNARRLPTVLVVLLATLGGAALTAAGLTVGRRVLARRQA